MATFRVCCLPSLWSPCGRKDPSRVLLGLAFGWRPRQAWHVPACGAGYPGPAQHHAVSSSPGRATWVCFPTASTCRSHRSSSPTRTARARRQLTSWDHCSARETVGSAHTSFLTAPVRAKTASMGGLMENEELCAFLKLGKWHMPRGCYSVVGLRRYRERQGEP